MTDISGHTSTRSSRACDRVSSWESRLLEKAGRVWFDQVADDLEGDGYAIRAIDLSPIAVGGSQVRQRLWFVACLDSIPPLWIAEPRQELFSWSPEPEMGCVAHDVSRRMDQLRVLGNAIVPTLAAQVIRAFLETEREVDGL